ncbi:HlyD family secretion protein [Tianweitania sp.]|uniref:HlyD family secretion protein n=1 Tax=Tianweitania sp. TaxID=2021634 RepID=UPI0028972754|nr:HlyD family secretion protein [Tianweitania sp.]
MSAVQEIDDEVETVEREAPKPVPAPAQAPAPAVAPVAAAAPAETPAQPKKKSSKMRYLVMAVVPLLLVGGGIYYWVTGGRFQETENANLRQARVTIASEIAGRITAVNLHENQTVKAGDLLFAVDPEPYRIALAQAEASLAGARLNVEQLRASLGQAEAQQRSEVGEVAYLQQELDRQTALSGKGVTTQSSLDTARRNLDKARDAERAAAQAVVGAKAALGGNPDIKTDEHPSVLAALATRDRAAYQLEQTTVNAPADGIVSQAASFKEGQFVSAGSSLFTLVETGDAWVEANFKETQLTHMKLGQKAEIELDTFPGRPIEATVDSIGAGTGAEFSLLPAQNATGNWVKVTQRIPVRLKINEADADLLLRTGMSATVNVDTGVSRGWGSLIGHAYAGTPAAPQTQAAN